MRVQGCTRAPCYNLLMLTVRACASAGMYLWAEIPSYIGGTDVAFCQDLLMRTGVALSPGSGFGPGGNGHVRFALVWPSDILRECARRIGQVLQHAKATA